VIATPDELEDLIEGIPHGVMMLGRDLEVLGWNSWLAVHLKMSRADVLGIRLNQLFPNRSFRALRRRVRTVRLLGNTAFFDPRVDAPLLPIPNSEASLFEAQEMPQSVVVAPIEGSDAVVVTISDYSHVAAMDELVQRTQMELARSNAALSSFGAIVSHDLKAPLRHIILLSEFLMEDHAAELSAEPTRYVAAMADAARRMETMIRALLDYSQVSATAPSFETVDLGLIVGDLARDLEGWMAERGATLHMDPLPIIQADPMQMRQLFQNLIVNGLKYAKPGVAPRMVVSALTSARNATMRFTDNGRGMAAEDIDRLLQPFQRVQAAEEGHGLGLAIVNTIVERHGGTLEVDSTLGEGTTFSVVLPKSGPASR